VKESRFRYYVTEPGRPEREVSFEDFRRAERDAGFNAPAGRAATTRFSGLNGVTGRTEYVREDPA
jgi:hypothetical protein